MYADYRFYVDEYYGKLITEQEFPELASRGSEFIDYITFGKAKKAVNASDPLYPTDTVIAIKKCCCALAEQYEAINKAKAAVVATIRADGEIQSETVGAHSRSFRSGADTANTVTATEAELANIARRYLLPTGLLYRGGVSGVCSSCCNAL